MNIEGLIAQVMPEIADTIRQEREKLAGRHSWYENEERTHKIMRRVGHQVAQALANAEGTGQEGPSRRCQECGGEQSYHDQHHALTLHTSVGAIRFAQRAAYRCPTVMRVAIRSTSDWDCATSGERVAICKK